MSQQTPNFYPPSSIHQTPSFGPERHVYVDPGRQPYINPAFIPQNQNFYTSPVIQNPPVPNTYGVQDPYANYYNYYNNYYQGHGGCGCAGYQQSNAYYGAQYNPYAGYGSQQYSPCSGYQNNQGNCGCTDCGQYSAPTINRERITPKFPSKLGHSYITSGDQVQKKQVINEPVSESAPFQTQRRKTYQPYTRKYIEYQDHIQYVPVQRSEWAYKKVMKQIDFVPQEYYQTSVETVPRERVDYKVRYLPVEKEFVHVPQDVLNQPQPQPQQARISSGQQMFRNTLQTNASSVIRPDGHFSRNTTDIPLHSLNIIRASNPPTHSKVLHTIYEQNSPTPIIRPAESTVEMVSNKRLQPFVQDASQRSGTFGGMNHEGGYKFPSTGGVMIGQASHARQDGISSSFGPGSQLQARNNPGNAAHISSSNVLHSGYGTQVMSQYQTVNRGQSSKQVEYGRNFRDSNHVQSQDLNFDQAEYHKKQSFAHRFEGDSD